MTTSPADRTHLPAVDHFIGGKRTVASRAGATHAVINPATTEPLAQVDLESIRAADDAIAAAREAFPAWSSMPVGDRCQFLFRYKQVLEQRFDELASIIVKEHGKTMAEARGDVRRGIDCVEHACAAPVLLMGR